MNSQFQATHKRKLWSTKKHYHKRNNQILMNKLHQIFPQLKSKLIEEETNLVALKPILSKMLVQWVNIELNQQTFDRNTQYNQKQQLNQNQTFQQKQQQNFSTQILQYQYSLKCQISGKITTKPARTSHCRYICLVDRSILQQTGVCSCGREVEKYQNQIVDDWPLSLIIKYYQTTQQIIHQDNESQLQAKKRIVKNKQKQNQNQTKDKSFRIWKGLIRINLQQVDFEFIFQ